jgi:hypothetical protein
VTFKNSMHVQDYWSRISDAFDCAMIDCSLINICDSLFQELKCSMCKLIPFVKLNFYDTLL